ncbi:MAG: PepSY domain-containing protein [Verrucomicrobiae bacterium]|nr:PepSY domain-containing protein [Verrucomicrobiae bacterium]
MRHVHRWVGFVIVCPLLIVSFTGVLLNHADDLSLNERQVSSPWLLHRYGMGLSGEPVSFPIGQRAVTSWAGQLFLNGTGLGLTGEVTGVTATPDGISIVCSDAVHLLAENGTLLETLDQTTLPEGRIRRAARGGYIQLEDESIWQFTGDYLECLPVDKAAADLAWSTSGTTSGQLRKQISQGYSGGGLPWSRLLLDIHSGRFFGPIGRWLVDGCVLLLVVLSITGLRLGIRNYRNKATESRGQQNLNQSASR